MQRALLTLLIGLGLGVLGGVLFGWYIPIQPTSTGLDRLHPDYKADYAVMVGAAYAVDGDWDLAQARLGRLAEPDQAGYIVQLTELYVYEGRSPDDIRNLARLATRFGYTTSPMLPYLPPTPTSPNP
jgi:hypothetical protein